MTQESKSRRFGYVVGRILALAVGYVLFVVSSPLLGLWLLWDHWRKASLKNVFFADFGRK